MYHFSLDVLHKKQNHPITYYVLPVIFDVLIELPELFQLKNNESTDGHDEKQRRINSALDKHHGFKVLY